jgi:hypothetical protein
LLGKFICKRKNKNNKYRKNTKKDTIIEGQDKIMTTTKKMRISVIAMKRDKEVGIEIIVG